MELVKKDKWVQLEYTGRYNIKCITPRFQAAYTLRGDTYKYAKNKE